MTTTYRFEQDLYLHDDDQDNWTMGPTPAPIGRYTPNADLPPVDWDGATIAGHESPGWLTAVIVVGTIVGSALVGAYGFLWVAGRMLRAVGA